jgi:serine/threonine protein kinase
MAEKSEIVSRFQREAQAAGSLENENIAAVVDAGTAEDGAPYLVMEYLEGEDLAHLLVRSGPLPVPRAAYVIIQACRGLAAAHGRGIVHRDLKPENLFVCKRNDGSDLVKVLDFGIAKLHTGATAGLTQTGTTMGTPFYMSLEQARGAKEVDQRTDIYALGVYLTISASPAAKSRILKILIATSEIVTLYSGGLVPRGIAVDDATVYWTDNSLLNSVPKRWGPAVRGVLRVRVVFDHARMACSIWGLRKNITCLGSSGRAKTSMILGVTKLRTEICGMSSHTAALPFTGQSSYFP